jgi:very-short-patch-repair endonuclease
MKKLPLLNTSEYLTERSIRQALEETNYRVYAQLPLNKVIQRERGDKLSSGDRKFLQKSELDFVIYNQNSLPELAIEFDGPAHRACEKKRQNDIRKNRLCKRAGLPLVRVSDVHLEQHDRTTTLEYMINRFVSWHDEINGILDEIKERLSEASEEEIERLTEDGILDPDIDPTFIFDLRHPFPGTIEVANRLYADFKIVSPYLRAEVWQQAMEQSRVLEFSYFGSQDKKERQTHYIAKDCNYKLLERVRRIEDQTSTNVIHEIQVTFHIQWTLPLVEDYDGSETQFQYYLRTGNFPVTYQNIPGISIPELADNFCDFLALREIEKWAKENLIKKPH